jgi:hypothetical protein
MSKEKILNAIHIKWLSKAKTAVINGEEMTVLPYGYLTQACSEVIDQTREETIKKTLKEIRDYIRDNEKLGYENRVLVGDEIYAKLSIMYDKSLINK